LRTTSWALLGASLLFVLSASAQAPSAAKIDEFMHKSGAWAQLDSATTALLAPGRYDDRLNSAQRASFKTAKEANFSAEVMRDRYRAALSKRLTAADVDAALRWFDGEPGRTLVRLEDEYSKSGGATAHDKDAKRLVGVLGSDRKDRLDRITRGTGSGERSVKFILDITLAGAQMAEAISGHRFETEEIKRKFTLERATLVQRSEEASLAHNAYAYRSVSLENLDKYIAFLESPAGKRCTDASYDALAETIVTGANEAGKYLMSRKDQDIVK
jgi:hypothetical protein